MMAIAISRHHHLALIAKMLQNADASAGLAFFWLSDSSESTPNSHHLQLPPSPNNNTLLGKNSKWEK